MDDKVKNNCLHINGTNGTLQTNELPSYKFKSQKETTELSNGHAETSDSNKENTPPESDSRTNGKMVLDENAINDGADEQMLGAEEKGKLTEKREEVKFIKGDAQNGDSKIDIGIVNGKGFTGMSKEELMKFANDPFWKRLRCILFTAFWLVWASMLLLAVWIIIKAPKCSTPDPLPWYKRGPLARFNSLESFTEEDIDATKNIQASGAIYELPPQMTYLTSEPMVEEKIKNIVAKYKDSNINVILDITPNYVDKDSSLFKNALADESKRSAFVWIKQPQVPNNWVSIKNGTAWKEVTSGNFVLSQFGDDLYDLHMNDSIVKSEFKGTLRHLIDLGVKGIRLRNSKFYLVSKNIQSEVPVADPRYYLTDYGFWTHTQTTFQEGLGDLLAEYSATVKNSSSDAFVSVTEDILRPEAYQTKNGALSVELPIYGRFLQFAGALNGPKMQTEIVSTMNAVGNHTFLQWDLKDLAAKDKEQKDPTALVLYISMIPGVPVIPIEAEMFKNVSSATFKHVSYLRHSPSFMHGDFELYTSNQLLGYSRIKTGNPGYFVVLNPTDDLRSGNFTNMGLPEKMTVDSISGNYNVSQINVKSKLIIDDLPVSPQSTIILTYVPIK